MAADLIALGLASASVVLVLLGIYGIGRTLQVRPRSPHPELAADLIAYFATLILAGVLLGYIVIRG